MFVRWGTTKKEIFIWSVVVAFSVSFSWTAENRGDVLISEVEIEPPEKTWKFLLYGNCVVCTWTEADACCLSRQRVLIEDASDLVIEMDRVLNSIRQAVHHH